MKKVFLFIAIFAFISAFTSVQAFFNEFNCNLAVRANSPNHCSYMASCLGDYYLIIGECSIKCYRYNVSTGELTYLGTASCLISGNGHSGISGK